MQKLRKKIECVERKQQQHEQDLSETAHKVKELEQTSKENTHKIDDTRSKVEQLERSQQRRVTGKRKSDNAFVEVLSREL